MTKKNVVTDMLERSGVVSASNQRKKPWPKKGGKVKWSPEKFKRCEEAVGDSVKDPSALCATVARATQEEASSVQNQRYINREEFLMYMEQHWDWYAEDDKELDYCEEDIDAKNGVPYGLISKDAIECYLNNVEDQDMADDVGRHFGIW